MSPSRVPDRPPVKRVVRRALEISQFLEMSKRSLSRFLADPTQRRDCARPALKRNRPQAGEDWYSRKLLQRRCAHAQTFIELLLVLETEWRPRNGLQALRLN